MPEDFEKTMSFTATFDPRTIMLLFGKDIPMRRTTGIDRVLFNDPATIVFWKDKTKTVVKCHPEDTFDEEIGFMCCYLKRTLSSKEYTKFCEYLNDIWELKNNRLYKEALERKMAEEKKHECKCGRSYHVEINNSSINL